MRITKTWKLLVGLAILAWIVPAVTRAQYTREDLTSNLTAAQGGDAPNVNPELVNAWGLVQLGTSPVWLSDNGSGFFTLYDGSGKQIPLIVVVPGVGGAQGTPTGVVGNTGTRPISFSLTLQMASPAGPSLSSQH
jgi:hypothetical protein